MMPVPHNKIFGGVYVRQGLLFYYLAQSRVLKIDVLILLIHITY